MKEIYYYERDKDNRPVKTFCLLSEDGKMTKEIAYCSKNDNPCKTTGKNKAKGRALKAMKHFCDFMDKDGKRLIAKFVLNESDLSGFERKVLGI